MSPPTEGSEELAQITWRSFWLTEMKIFQCAQKLYCQVVFLEKQESELASIKKLCAIATFFAQSVNDCCVNILMTANKKR
jgi:hypothetical protein